MVLARPAKLAVADLVIIVVFLVFFLVCDGPQVVTVTDACSALDSR
jgi:hypothetical protein